MEQPLLVRHRVENGSQRRLISFALVSVVHLAALYALVTGLAVHVMEKIPQTITAMIVPARIQSQKPVPPPPELAAPQPPYVPPPDIVVQTQTPANTITVQSTTPAPAADATGPTLVPTEPVGSTHNCDSYYPPIAQRLSQQGEVLVRYTVGADGVISNVAVAASSGFATLDQAAVDCVRQSWRNLPAMENGKAVVSTSEAYVSFVLQE